MYTQEQSQLKKKVANDFCECVGIAMREREGERWPGGGGGGGDFVSMT